MKLCAVVPFGWVVVEPPVLKPRSERVDTHYFKLFGHTAELGSRLAGLSVDFGDGIEVGEVLFNAVESTTVPVVVPAHSRRIDGRLRVVGQGWCRSA